MYNNVMHKYMDYIEQLPPCLNRDELQNILVGYLDALVDFVYLAHDDIPQVLVEGMQHYENIQH